MSAASDLTTWLTSPDPMRQRDEDLFKAFLVEEDIDVPDDVDDFEEWVKANYADRFAGWFDERLGDLVEYYEITRNNDAIEDADTLRPGTWLIHFTLRTFTRFADGVPRKYLGQSRKVPAKDRVITCPQNLTLPPAQQQWVHAYPVFSPYGEGLNDTMLRGAGTYGHNALLFQSDEAVLGRHVVHEELMAFVLGCSEYNAIQLLRVHPASTHGRWNDTLAGTALTTQGEVQFDDLAALIDQLQRTARAGLGSRRRRSRWHRLAQPPRR